MFKSTDQRNSRDSVGLLRVEVALNQIEGSFNHTPVRFFLQKKDDN